MQKAIDALNKADRTIKKRHRYQCGLERPAVKGVSVDSFGISTDSVVPERLRTFFLSPDGQNGELYYALRGLGFSHAKRDAEYYWVVRDHKTGWCISYTEGDVEIYNNLTD